MDSRELKAIKARAEAVRRVIQVADEARTMKEQEDAAMLLISGSRRVDDDLFALLAEVERLRRERDEAQARWAGNLKGG